MNAHDQQLTAASLATSLLDRGFNDSEVAEHLVKKFGLSTAQAAEQVEVVASGDEPLAA